MTNNTHASPCKLQSGAWGAKTKTKVQEGQIVTITTRGGKSWEVRVTQVVWSDGKATIVATESCDRPVVQPTYRPAAQDHYAEYCGYVCTVSRRRCCASNGPCHDCE